MPRLGRSTGAVLYGRRIAVAQAVVTGTVTASILETAIVTGGKTVIITISGDIWVASGGAFDGQRQNIIDGMDSGQAEAAGWDAVVKALQGVAGVIRTSDTVATITLDAQATYNITASETITVTVPATALAAGSTNVIATPTFSISSGVGGPLAGSMHLIGGVLVSGRLALA